MRCYQGAKAKRLHYKPNVRQSNRYLRLLRHRRRRDGMCVRCGKCMEDRTFKMCHSCRAAASAYQRSALAAKKKVAPAN